MTEPRLADLEHKLGRPFKNRQLGIDALTHSSLLNEADGAGRDANQRLAHLGDAVVELVVRAALFHRFPRYDKGELTEKKRGLVSDEGLAGVAKGIGLADLVQRGKSHPDNPTVWAESFEAAMAAVFLDSDYATAAKLVEKFVPIPEA